MFRDLKNRKDDEQQMEEEGRLPPGQSLTKKFPVLHYGPVPNFNPSTWDLKVWGEVESEVSWTWDEFEKLPREKIIIDLHCVTRWSKFNTEWEGVKLSTLVNEGIIKLKPTAKYLIQHAEFGFTVNLPVEVALGDNFLLATHFNGEAITPEHGYPLRAVIGAVNQRDDLEVPYLWKGAKWLRGIEFKEQDQLGFWEQAGYHNQANVWKEQRFGR